MHISLAHKKVLVKWHPRDEPKVERAEISSLEEQMQSLGLEQPPVVLRQTTERTPLPGDLQWGVDRIPFPLAFSFSLCLDKERPGTCQGQA